MTHAPGADIASDDTGRSATPAWSAVRVARPVRRLARSLQFYRDVLGLPVTGGFDQHDGYDGVFFRLPGEGELELTHGPQAPVSTSEEDLLVLYLPTWAEVEVVAGRLTDAGARKVPSANPYWNRSAQTYLDPDGYRVVIAIRS